MARVSFGFLGAMYSAFCRSKLHRLATTGFCSSICIIVVFNLLSSIGCLCENKIQIIVTLVKKEIVSFLMSSVVINILAGKKGEGKDF